MSGEENGKRSNPKPELPATANEDAGGGETRSPILKAVGDDDPMSCKGTRKAPETQVSGVFVFAPILSRRCGATLVAELLP